MAGDKAVETARRHASSETIERAARRFLDLVAQNPGVRRGVLAERVGAAFGVCAGSVMKAAKALPVPVAQNGGLTTQALSEERRRQAAIDYFLMAERHPTDSRTELAWAVATPLGVTASAIRRWAREFGIRVSARPAFKFVVGGPR